jgi:hypothetical protein
MVNADRYRRGKESLELIEEAIHLLHSAPAFNLAVYYSGTLPFVLAALYFWADMSRSPFAGQRLVGEALVLGCLFLWMKTCQAFFCRAMRCVASGESRPRGVGRLWRIFLVQSALQPSGLFVLPLALVPALPFAWVFAFYQNLGALDDGETVDCRGLVKKAAIQSVFWPRQNHLILAIITAFGFFVWLNLVTACFVLPGLVKTLLGVETVFTRSGLSLLNTTLFAATLGLTYICLDPILKTIYALRCFYGESQRSGADLKVELHGAGVKQLSLALILGLLVAFGIGEKGLVAAEQSQSRAMPAGEGQPAHQSTVVSSVSALDLDRAIDEVIQRPRYAWREPRKGFVQQENDSNGLFDRLFERLRPFLKNCFKTIRQWLDSLIRRFFLRQRTVSSNDAADRLAVFLRLLVYALIAATVAGLIWLSYRIWEKRRRKAMTIASEPLQPVPDLLDENLGAEQLPEDSWMRLARELLAKGELRLALRSFYLASLAQLAGNNLIHLARSKSNWDYERELQRRAHAIPGLLDAFVENLSVFDRTWYGMYEVNPELVNQFAHNVERIRSAMTVTSPASAPA